MKKVKVKFTKNDGIHVTIPYKNGSVVWALAYYGVTLDWKLVKHGIYNPTRVRSCHLEYLKGKGVRKVLTRAAAASHQYDSLANLRRVFMNIEMRKLF